MLLLQITLTKKLFSRISLWLSCESNNNLLQCSISLNIFEEKKKYWNKLKMNDFLHGSFEVSAPLFAIQTMSLINIDFLRKISTGEQEVTSLLLVAKKGNHISQITTKEVRFENIFERLPKFSSKQYSIYHISFEVSLSGIFFEIVTIIFRKDQPFILSTFAENFQDWYIQCISLQFRPLLYLFCLESY